jgi:hypothetical protein
MKSELRPTSADDLGAVCKFLQRAFNVESDAGFLGPAVMAWKYWDRRDDWSGPRAYVLEREGVIVAHAGLWPLTFEQDGVRGVHMIDWASARESPGAGLALVQKLAGMFDFILAIGGTEMTRKALPAFGFVEYAKQWNGAVPIRPLRLMLTHLNRNWKLAARFVRNSLWALNKRPAKGWKTEQIAPEAICPDLYFQSAPDAFFSQRAPAFFEYLLRCPAAQVRLYGIWNERGMQGHFAIALVRGQARVAGVWLREPNPAAWKVAFSLARQAALDIDGACELVVTGTEGPSEDAAIQAGLKIVRHSPVYLLNKKGKLKLRPNFQFQFSENDVLYLDMGDSAYWT